jgi:hypothetical protein
MTERQRFRREMSAILGVYVSNTDHVVLADPRTLGVPEEYVLIHEIIHRLLVNGTMVGVFERVLVHTRARAESEGRLDFAHALDAIFDRILDDTHSVHEAAAGYVELCRVAEDGVSGDSAAEAYIESFSPDLARAVTPLIELLGLPRAGSPLLAYQWVGAVLLAKLALNGPILQHFTDPASLTHETFERFEEVESPHRRFQQLCLETGRKGGLAFVARSISECVLPHWDRFVRRRPRFYELPGGETILDLVDIGGGNSPLGTKLVEHAEHRAMRVLAGAVPDLAVTIGTEEMHAAASPFIHTWSGLEIQVVVTPPGDERRLFRDRAYAVRFKVEEPGSVVTLDEFREFLTTQSAHGRITLAGFLQTVDDGAAVFGASFGAKRWWKTDPTLFDRTKWKWPAALKPEAVLVARMDLLQVLDFALLRWDNEPYAANVAWHVPLEVAHALGFPNIAVGLHGMLLRSWAASSPHGLVSIARDAVRARCRVHGFAIDWAEQGEDRLILNWGDTIAFKHVRQGSIAIVLEIIDERGALERLPCASSFIAWLGTHVDADGVKAALSGDASITWGGGPNAKDGGLVNALLEVAYNLDGVLGSHFPVRLVPVKNPYLRGQKFS